MTPSPSRWVQIQLFWTECTAIYPAGKSQSSGLNILRTITVLLLTTWQSLSESCAKSSMGTRWTDILGLGEIWISETRLQFGRWLTAIWSCCIQMESFQRSNWKRFWEFPWKCADVSRNSWRSWVGWSSMMWTSPILTWKICRNTMSPSQSKVEVNWYRRECAILGISILYHAANLEWLACFAWKVKCCLEMVSLSVLELARTAMQEKRQIPLSIFWRRIVTVSAGLLVQQQRITLSIIRICRALGWQEGWHSRRWLRYVPSH